MDLSFEEFRGAIEEHERSRELLFVDGRPFFVLLTQQFSRQEIEKICDTATAIRRLDRNYEGRTFLRGLLQGQRVMNLFGQPSTRTAESFIAAAEKLGASARVISDLNVSSMAKGETVEDSVRTLSSFFDIIVTRHADDTFATRAAWGLSRSGRPIPVISAGAGRSQHVTQSLLDIYTLRYGRSRQPAIDGSRIAIIGDVARNRAARSLAFALARFSVGRIDFVAPEAYLPDATLIADLKSRQIDVGNYPSIRALMEAGGRELDAIYMTRLQQEWDQKDASVGLGTSEDFVLKNEFRERIRPDCLILHPLPRVNELPDEWESHPGFMVWRQVRNGMWVRAALFATIYGADLEIRARAARLSLVDEA
jgi:aspartate carbamoyltransferase